MQGSGGFLPVIQICQTGMIYREFVRLATLLWSKMLLLLSFSVIVLCHLSRVCAKAVNAVTKHLDLYHNCGYLTLVRYCIACEEVFVL